MDGSKAHNRCALLQRYCKFKPILGKPRFCPFPSPAQMGRVLAPSSPFHAPPSKQRVCRIRRPLGRLDSAASWQGVAEVLSLVCKLGKKAGQEAMHYALCTAGGRETQATRLRQVPIGRVVSTTCAAVFCRRWRVTRPPLSCVRALTICPNNRLSLHLLWHHDRSCGDVQPGGLPCIPSLPGPAFQKRMPTIVMG